MDLNEKALVFYYFIEQIKKYHLNDGIDVLSEKFLPEQLNKAQAIKNQIQYFKKFKIFDEYHPSLLFRKGCITKADWEAEINISIKEDFEKNKKLLDSI